MTRLQASKLALKGARAVEGAAIAQFTADVLDL